MTLKCQQGTQLYSHSWDQDDITQLFHATFRSPPVCWPSCLTWAEPTISMIDIFKLRPKMSLTISMNTKPRTTSRGPELFQ